VITLRNISKNYEGVQAVDDISLKIHPNTVHGIMGRSGAGKSTLVRLMSLLECPDNGEVFFNDCRVDNLKGKALRERRRQLGMVFQNFNLFLSRNVFSNVAYPLEIAGVDKRSIQNRVYELLDLVELSSKIEYPINRLSGGQKQRIAIARALAHHPKILFCDEATSALDPQTTLTILQLIKDIQNRMNLTVVMITHQMEVVKEICAFVSIIDNGKVIKNESVQNLFSFPHTGTAHELISPLRYSDVILKKQRLHLVGNTTEDILSRLAKIYHTNVNIVTGSIRSVNNKSVSNFIIELTISEGTLNTIIADLRSQKISIEVLHA
jgi:D-methionine transport system ATP-binding protein